MCVLFADCWHGLWLGYVPALCARETSQSVGVWWHSQCPVEHQCVLNDRLPSHQTVSLLIRDHTISEMRRIRWRYFSFGRGWKRKVFYLNLDKSESDNVWSVTYDCHHIVYQLTINGLHGVRGASDHGGYNDHGGTVTWAEQSLVPWPCLTSPVSHFSF